MPTRPRSSPAAAPKYGLHKPTGQARVRLGGRDFYLGPHGSDESHARYRRLVAQWMEHGEVDDDAYCCSELIVDYLEQHVETYYVKAREVDGELVSEPTSRQDVIRSALRPVRRLFGMTPVRDFGPRALKACRESFVERGLARRTVNLYTEAIREMFQWGVAEELVPSHVHEALKAVRGLKRGRTKAVERGPVKPVPEAFVEAVRPHVSRQVWGMIRLQLLTGMRPGEVVLVRAIDLDTSGAVWIFRPLTHKTEHHDRAREVFLGPRAQAVLGEFLKPDLHAFLFSPADAEAERNAERAERRETKRPPSQRDRERAERPRRPPGERYTTESYRRAIARGIAAANRKRREDAGEGEDVAAIPTWSPNRLRHNAGTLARREAGLETAQVVLGHSKADVTEIYAETDRRKAVEFVAQHG